MSGLVLGFASPNEGEMDAGLAALAGILAELPRRESA